MDKKKIVMISIWVIIIVGALILIQWRTGNVVLEMEKSNYAAGDSLSGKLTVVIQPGDSVPDDTPLLIMLTDENNNVLAVNSISLKEFIQSSDNVIESVDVAGKKYYESPGTYSVPADKLIKYTFSEKGNYELFFNVFKLNIATKEKITVN
jgi:hypothetical protein